MTWKFELELESVLRGGLEILLQSKAATKGRAFSVATYEGSWPLNMHRGRASQMRDRLVKSVSSNELDTATKTL